MLSRSFVRMLSRGRRRHYKWRSMYCESKLLCFIILVQLQPAAKLASEAVRKNSYSFCYVLYYINLTIVRLVCGLDCIHLYDRECIGMKWLFMTTHGRLSAAVIIALSSPFRVKHTNIVYLMEVFDSKSKLYLVMEL